MDELLPYLAGFIDGEGSIAIGLNRNSNGERRWYLRFSAHQTNPGPLTKLMEVFGGSIHQSDPENRKTIYEWAVSSMDAYEALLALRPFLVVKADEADVGIEFQRLLLSRGTRRGALTGEERLARETLYLRLRELKRVEFVDAIPAKVLREKKPKPPKKTRHKVAVPVRSTGYDRRKRPTADELREVYERDGANATALHFGVSRQTFYNWLDRYEIPRAGRTQASEERRREALKNVWREDQA